MLSIRSSKHILAATVAAAALMAAWPAAAENPPAYLANFPNFAPNLTPAQLPGDVDTTLKKKLDADRKFAEVQRLFDLWSWQAFVSLNWPTDKPGHPLSDAKDYSAAPPDWTLWTESTDVFRPKGERPPVCGKSAAELLTFALTPTAPTVPPVRGLEAFKLPPEFNGRKTRLLGNISAVGEVNAVNPGQPNAVNQLADINQAFSGPLVDQNGNFVYYEILIDPHEVKYICDNNLYSIDGQIQFAAKGGKVTLPSGVDTQDSSGAFELKLAWKILTAGDDPARYLTLPAIVATAVNGKQVETQVTVGLVGMHIAHKSDSSPQWIWATFEQVDNLEVDAVAHPGLKPSFFDPGCEICVPNQEPHKNPDGSWTNSPKTQASRGVPIPKDKQDLNAQARLVLAKIGSPLQYYQLIDTQWPTEPKAPPSPWNAGLPDAITNKPGGHPTPVYLTNITMETYFQKGVQSACRQEETPGNLDCPPPPITYPAPGTISDGTKVFGTESCMGCHSSAGIYISDSQQPKKSGQLTGDFSWLFTQKAQ